MKKLVASFVACALSLCLCGCSCSSSVAANNANTAKNTNAAANTNADVVVERPAKVEDAIIGTWRSYAFADAAEENSMQTNYGVVVTVSDEGTLTMALDSGLYKFDWTYEGVEEGNLSYDLVSSDGKLTDFECFAWVDPVKGDMFLCLDSLIIAFRQN